MKHFVEGEDRTQARRVEQAPSPNSTDLHFQGLAWLNKGVTPDNVVQARSLLDRALTSDPNNVDALFGLALERYPHGMNRM